MIVGRDAELSSLRTAVAAALDGHAQVVALVGDPGVGKTTLLEALVGTLPDPVVLRLTGMPSESTLGYSGLAVLCRRLTDHLDALPPRQRRAVEACLTEVDTSEGARVDLLALGSALITLLAEAASEAPVLLLVDDLQWVDPESRRAVGFALRRLSSERVLAVLASRTEAAVPEGITTRIAVLPLRDTSARQVLDAVSTGLSDEDAERIVLRAKGNPLAVVELARSHRVRPGSSLDPRADPHADDDHDVFADQVSALTSAGSRALLLAALDGRVDLALVAAALESEGVDVAGVDELIVAGLVIRTGSAAALRHPLLAGSAVSVAGPRAVRSAHAALARALAPYDPTRAMWHRAQATVGPDEGLASHVAASADRARRRGRPDEASLRHEVAAALTLRPERRATWLVDSAESALASADSARASQLAARAREVPPDSTEILARLQALEGLLGLRIGWRHELGQSVIEACRTLPADRAGPLLVTIARVAVGERDNAVAREAVDSLEALGAGSPEFRELVRSATAFDRNEPHPAAEDVTRVTRMFQVIPSTGDIPTLTTTAALALEWGRISLARDLLLRAGELARATGDLDAITEAAFGVAFCDHTLGAWTSAYARAWEVSQLLLDVDLPERLSEALLLQAEIDAARGHSERCRQTCSRVRDTSAVLRDPLFGMLAERREALLDLGLGNLEQAAVRLEAVHALSRIHAMDQPYLSPIPDLVEVYVRSKRTEDAHVVAREFLERVGPASPPLPRARALRITGLLAEPGTDYDTAFTESVELDLSVGLAFHAARTMLCHAERLRRDRRRVDARAKLHAALDIFHRLDAVPWVERCESELAASGAAVGTPREADPSLLLTPQELQVAILVAEGRRNREIAEMLFLSLRTIESHLSRVFRKLGVDSRTQLAVRMNGGAGDQALSPRPTLSR